MSKKGTMSSIKYELFGVGGEEKSAPQNGKAPGAPATQPAPAAKPAATAPAARPAMSLLAAGTAFEGTLSAKGDVEIAGEFKGSVITKGAVRLRSDIQSTIDAGSLEVTGCVLTGDVTVAGSVTVDERSRIVGSITAKELVCAGEIAGDLKVSDSVRLEAKARVNGNIVTGTISVEKGAAISGNVQIKAAAAAAPAPAKG